MVGSTTRNVHRTPCLIGQVEWNTFCSWEQPKQTRIWSLPVVVHWPWSLWNFSSKLSPVTLESVYIICLVSLFVPQYEPLYGQEEITMLPVFQTVIMSFIKHYVFLIWISIFFFFFIRCTQKNVSVFVLKIPVSIVPFELWPEWSIGCSSKVYRQWAKDLRSDPGKDNVFIVNMKFAWC